MRNAIRTLAVLAMLTPAIADEFHLTDATGKAYGPFEFRQGEQLSIAGQLYTISKVLTKEQKIIEKMKTIIIPEMDFRQANIRDVVDFLEYQSGEYDREPERPRGVSTVLNLSPEKPTPAKPITDPFAGDPFFTKAPAPRRHTSSVPLVTFSARGMSVHDAMNIVCKICNLQWSIQDSVVMIESKKRTEEVQQPPERDK